MKLLILFVFILININNVSYAQWGKGELKLSKESMEHLMRYMYGAGNEKYGFGKSKNKPSIFVVSEDGNSSFYSYCPYVRCEPPNQGRAIRYCEKNSLGSSCYVMALKRRIVWKNGNKKVKIKNKMLHDPAKVALAIKDAGFYDGNIYDLAGIDYQTGQSTEKKIDGKSDDNKVQGEDVITQLRSLKELLDENIITKEEFEKLKKKLLN